jgi:hypothetical protein
MVDRWDEGRRQPRSGPRVYRSGITGVIDSESPKIRESIYRWYWNRSPLNYLRLSHDRNGDDLIHNWEVIWPFLFSVHR